MLLLEFAPRALSLDIYHLKTAPRFLSLLSYSLYTGAPGREIITGSQPVYRLFKFLLFYSIVYKVQANITGLFSLIYDYNKEKLLTENFILF